jgi:CRISPR-associated protein Cmr1
LGSRARKGLGSLSIQRIRDTLTQEFATRLDIQHFIDSLDYSAPSRTAPLTAFGMGARIDLSPGQRSPLACLQQVNQCLQLYRDGTIQGHERESNFKQDRSLAAEAAKGKPIPSLPQRAVFGLPHNYFWIESKAKLDIAPDESTRNRRASPLFIHVHQFPDGQCSIIHCLLPSLFLPAGSRIKLSGKGTTSLDNPKVDFGVITRYMDRFTRENNGEVLRHGQ